jgi:proteasome component ECM29
MTSAENEKLLLDRVLSRFALAESDAAFTQALLTLLVPTLQVLTSPHAESRNKVVSVLAHVNKRAKNNSDIKLPLKALVAQFKDDKSNAFLRNFNILYIDMAFERSSEIERLEVSVLFEFFVACRSHP